jgi:hypothetical protein
LLFISSLAWNKKSPCQGWLRFLIDQKQNSSRPLSSSYFVMCHLWKCSLWLNFCLHLFIRISFSLVIYTSILCTCILIPNDFFILSHEFDKIWRRQRATWILLLINEKAKSTLTRWLLHPNHLVAWALPLLLLSKVIWLKICIFILWWIQCNFTFIKGFVIGPEEILIKLAIVLKISKSSWNTAVTVWLFVFIISSQGWDE